MNRQRLNEILMRALAALWTMAMLNRRMTAKGVVGALVLVGARYGFDVSAETQTFLAGAIVLYLGLVGRDHQRRIR